MTDKTQTTQETEPTKAEMLETIQRLIDLACFSTNETLLKASSDAEDALEAIRKELSRDRWQNIETAPKDQTRIIVTRIPATGKPPMNLVRWGQIHTDGGHHLGWKVSYRKELRYLPTHWHSLPQPPKVTP